VPGVEGAGGRSTKGETRALVNAEAGGAVGVQEAKRIRVKLLEAGKAVCSST